MIRRFSKEAYAAARAESPSAAPSLPRHLKFAADELRHLWCKAERFGRIAEADELRAKLDAIYHGAGVSLPTNEYKRPGVTNA